MTGPQLYPVEPDVLRYKLTKMMPYFSDIIYRLRPQVQEGLGTFGCDERFNWYYDKEVPFTPDEQLSVLFHEINHLLRNHFGRCVNRDPVQWNVAGDREINDWWPQGLTPPVGGIGSKKYGLNDLELPDDELAEWYFDRIVKYDAHVREDATAMSPGSGKCVSHPGCDSQDSEPTLDKTGLPIQRGKKHVPACGGAAGNPGKNEHGPGQGKDGGVSEVEAEAVRQSIAEKVMGEHARGRGNLPGALVAWADNLLNPVVPWTKLLRTATRKASTIIAGDTDNTFQRPARRSPPRLLLPKRIARKTVAAFYIDTSGSVSDEEVQQAIAEVKGALRTNLADLSISLVDTEVYSTVKAGRGTFKRPKKLQRGGTDMRQCFEHAVKQIPRPNLLVIMTDGETPWPTDPNRDMRTIIVLTSKPSSSYKIPAWVWKTIQIEDHR